MLNKQQQKKAKNSPYLTVLPQKVTLALNIHVYVLTHQLGGKHQLRSESAFSTSCKPINKQRFGSTKAGIANTHARTTPSLEVVSPAVQLVLAAVQESSDTQQLPADYSGTVFLRAAYTEKLPLACIWQMFICFFQICFFSKMFLSFLCFFPKT